MSGRIFVLTSRRTFSAAIVSLAYLKQAGSNRVVIVGEPVGDRLMFFADGHPIRLPHSGLFLQRAEGRWDLRDGCRRYDDCVQFIPQPDRPAAPLPNGVRSVERLPIAVDTLDPDVYVQWRIESWLKGTDPMMDAVTALVAKERK